MNVAHEVLRSLAAWGSYPAALTVRSGQRAELTSAAELRADIIRLSRTLDGWGVRPGHPVALFLDNSLDFVRVFTALLLLGALPVPLKLEYRRLELDEVFSCARPLAVVTEESHLPVLSRYLQNALVVGHSAGGFRAITQPAPDSPPAELPGDIASLNFTYRGHGYPLGALVTHQQYLDGARALQEGLQGRPGNRLLVLLPMAHIFSLVGCVLVPLLYRMIMVISDSLHPRVIFEQLRSLEVNVVTAVPELYELLARVKDPEIRLPALEALVCGGSTLSTEAYGKVRSAFSAQLLHGYGLTEFAPVSRNVRDQARAGTVGPVCDGVECSIKDADADGEGEILVRCAALSPGYYRRPRETAEAHAGPWFRTGDIGRLDRGHLLFRRELKATRKVNGNMVDLNEVHRALLSIPGCREARLEYGQGKLSAAVELAEGPPSRDGAVALKQHLQQLVAGYKIPRVITGL
jgi:long-chain acyl-CoA synthetase